MRERDRALVTHVSNDVWADQNDIVWKAFEQRGIASPSEKGMTNEEKKPTLVMALSLMCAYYNTFMCAGLMCGVLAKQG